MLNCRSRLGTISPIYYNKQHQKTTIEMWKKYQESNYSSGPSTPLITATAEPAIRWRNYCRAGQQMKIGNTRGSIKDTRS
jgi:hypothetical protein